MLAGQEEKDANKIDKNDLYPHGIEHPLNNCIEEPISH